MKRMIEYSSDDRILLFIDWYRFLDDEGVLDRLLVEISSLW